MRGSSQQEARLGVLPAQDGALPHEPIPPVQNEKARRQMLVVPVQYPDPLQELPAVEETLWPPLGDNQVALRLSPGQRSHQNSKAGEEVGEGARFPIFLFFFSISKRVANFDYSGLPHRPRGGKKLMY